jgi:hypothetical protein
MSGQTFQNNIGQLYGSLQRDSSTAYQQGLAQIKASGGAGGTRFSTDTSAQIGSYSNNYVQNLNSTATSMGLSELGVQANTAQGILGELGTSANQYYNPGSKTSTSQVGNQIESGKTTQTGVTGGSSSQMSNTTQQQNSTEQQTQTGLNAWLDPIFNVIGGAAGIAGLFM